MNTEIEHNMPSKFRIIFGGDDHIGARSTNYAILDAIRDRVKKNKNIYYFGMGDVADAIEARDRRFTVDEHAHMTPAQQYEMAYNYRKPIKNKILGQICGNHDYKLVTDGTGDFVQIMMDRLGIPHLYGDYASVMKLNLPDGLSFKVYAWHGEGHPGQSNAKDPEQRTANMKANITRRLSSQMSDCHVMVMGHIHRLLAYRPPPEMCLYTDEGGDIVARRGHRDSVMDVRDYQTMKYIDPMQRWYGVTGTAKRSRMKGYITWEERCGFGASDLGWLELVCEDGKIWLEPKFWGES